MQNFHIYHVYFKGLYVMLMLHWKSGS